ncbi:MAG: choice-of-anchor D domain-containing protein [Deltaproteobacteria bacterium]|nr:choice-of-anchor D domain-containing protein [Deltaproteobacteria bacterium]
MRPNLISAGLVLIALAITDCTCNESLGLAVGKIELATCDRGSACGCQALEPAAGSVDFGSPAAGTGALRVLTIHNTNQPRKLTVSEITIGGGGDLFAITSVVRRDSAAADAATQTHNMTQGPLLLDGSQEAEVYLSFRPSSAGEFNATLTVRSTSPTYSPWVVALHGGGGTSSTCLPLGSCDDGTTLDFGTFDDSQIGLDYADPRGRPLALGTQLITVKNQGAAELFFAVEITNDGIPEADGELVGDTGVFFVGDVGCAVVKPGATGTIPVEYRPSSAGVHHGEVVVKAVGPVRHIPLLGKVVGASLCFRTEDDRPDDATLTFGAAPGYYTAVNRDPAERRSAFVKNCGFEKDLTIAAVNVAPGSAADFVTPALPWAAHPPLAPDAEIELPVTLHPVAAVGTPVAARYNFESNDRLRPTASLSLVARIGAPEQCVLVPAPSAVDFGWVASDDAEQGMQCPPPPLPCPGGGVKISRFQPLRLVNVGERACTQITLESMVPDSSSAGMFSVEENPNGDGFTLAPGATSEDVTLLFVRNPTDTVTMHYARLPYASPDMPISPFSVVLQAKAGGSPHCALSFQPVAAASFFCPLPSLAFGNVNIGQTKTMDLRLTNVGSETCNVTNIGPAPGTASAFTFPTTPLTIAVNAAAVIPVSFAPRPPSGNPFEELPFNCIQNGIQMTANSGAGGADEQQSVAFSGKGKPPSIQVIPGEVDFGLVTVGCCSAERRVAIYNTGAPTLTLDSIAILGGAASDFQIVSPASSMTIGNGQSTELTLRFCAAAVGPAADALEVQGHDDNGNQEYYSVALSGTGTTDNQGDDQFPQPLRPKVDVLWVVDDSGSMSDDQENLANNFDAFISRAVSLNADYHIGVTNSDGETEWSGRLHTCNAGRKYVTDTMPQAQQQSDFRCNVKTSQPADGRPSTDSKESPLQAAKAAFEYPNLDGWNATFYREDAALYVLMVTDETDQSDGSAQLYVDYFRNLKGLGNPDLLDVSAISGPPPDGCPSAEGNQPGYDVVGAVGGQFRSICTADWTDLINTLGLDVFHARRQFPLSRPATAASIEVHLCAGACPADPTTCPPVPQSPTAGWTFDATANAVTLNGNPEPTPGSCVAVTYLAVCYQ